MPEDETNPLPPQEPAPRPDRGEFGEGVRKGLDSVSFLPPMAVDRPDGMPEPPMASPLPTAQAAPPAEVPEE